MSVQLPVSDLVRIRDLFTLYCKKGAFNPEELVDAGTCYKHVVEALEQYKDETNGELPRKDVTYVLNSISVCSQRSAVEVQNYKPIAALFETLSELLKLEGEKKIQELE